MGLPLMVYMFGNSSEKETANKKGQRRVGTGPLSGRADLHLMRDAGTDKDSGTDSDATGSQVDGPCDSRMPQPCVPCIPDAKVSLKINDDINKIDQSFKILDKNNIHYYIYIRITLYYQRLKLSLKCQTIILM